MPSFVCNAVAHVVLVIIATSLPKCQYLPIFLEASFLGTCHDISE